MCFRNKSSLQRVPFVSNQFMNYFVVDFGEVIERKSSKSDFFRVLTTKAPVETETRNQVHCTISDMYDHEV